MPWGRMHADLCWLSFCGVRGDLPSLGYFDNECQTGSRIGGGLNIHFEGK
jgi:hypothetical protein